MATVSQSPVSLPYVDKPILGDRVTIPSEFWKYAAETINNVEQKDVWVSRDLPVTGVIRWLDVLPSVSETQLFAGIETVSILLIKLIRFWGFSESGRNEFYQGLTQNWDATTCNMTKRCIAAISTKAQWDSQRLAHSNDLYPKY